MVISFLLSARLIRRHYNSRRLGRQRNRVVAGIHWPSDILGGAVIGIAVGLLTHQLARKYPKPQMAA